MNLKFIILKNIKINIMLNNQILSMLVDIIYVFGDLITKFCLLKLQDGQRQVQSKII